MYYPKSVYCANETITRNNMKEYNVKRKIWYDTAEKLYPNYYQMGLKERLKAIAHINETCGFNLYD